MVAVPSWSTFHHKDAKNLKGQQDSVRYYFAASDLEEPISFPPINATRYSTHGDGDPSLIAYLELVRHILTTLADKKGDGLNHMERNIQNGLEDIPTLTELCALSIYSETVSHPCMRCVRIIST